MVNRGFQVTPGLPLPSQQKRPNVPRTEPRDPARSANRHRRRPNAIH